MPVLLMSGCRPFGSRPESPAHGGSSWNAVDTRHFSVLSDLPVAEAKATAIALEQGLAALTAIAFANPRGAVQRTTVVVFRDQSELQAFLPELVGGVYYSQLPNDLEPSPVLIISEGVTASTQELFFHELTHDLFARNFGWSPPWLSEGWAQYYSTLRVESDRAYLGGHLATYTISDGTDFYAGHTTDGRIAVSIPARALPRASELLNMDSRTFYEPLAVEHPELPEREQSAAHYAGAWALVHMLLDGGGSSYTTRFKTFLQHASTGEDLANAWKSAFADVTAASLDHDFQEYATRGELAVWEYHYTPKPYTGPLSHHRLSDSDVHILWARLVPWQGATLIDDGKVRRDLEQAALAAPNSPEPSYWQGVYALKRDDVQQAEKAFGLALGRAPDDPRTWHALTRLRSAHCAPGSSSIALRELHEAVLHLSKVATSATQLCTVASVLYNFSERDRGLAFAKRAIELAPYDSLVLDVYAAYLSDQGHAAEALTMQQRAVSFLPDGAKAPEIYERLRSYEERALGTGKSANHPQQGRSPGTR